LDSSQGVAVVVDELALVRLGLATVLRRLSIEVGAEVPGGREGAEVVRLQEPGLVVVGSPADMPLVEAVKRLRAAAETVKIVSLLGAGQVDTVAAIVAAGADGVALRGGAAGDVAEALGEVLAGRRFVAATLSTGLVGALEPAAGPENGDGLLTYREREVLALLAGGSSNREIAAALTVTVATVKSHLVHVYAKLEVRNRQEALSRAVGLGLLT
jgi:DNA-binding NarL/FixJ family response regulator